MTERLLMGRKESNQIIKKDHKEHFGNKMDKFAGLYIYCGFSFWVSLQFVIVLFPDHTHLLFWKTDTLCSHPIYYGM